MVVFRIAGGEIMPNIEISLSETIFDLKVKIKKELDVEVERQSLFYRNNVLRDYDLLQDYGFRGEEILNLKVARLPRDQKIHVLVKHNGANGYLRVKETDKVCDLRSKVERYWAIPSHLFALYRLNVEMSGNLPLHAYYINENSEIELKVLIEPR